MKNTKPIHLMTKNEIDYKFFKMTGIKPLSLNASKKEQDDFQRLLNIRLDLLHAEQNRRMRAGTWNRS